MGGIEKVTENDYTAFLFKRVFDKVHIHVIFRKMHTIDLSTCISQG